MIQPETFRSQAPAPLQPHPITIPAPREIVLPNGLTVVVVEERRLPLVSYRLAFRVGGAFDPPELPGLTDLLAGLLPEGTQSRTSREIAEALVVSARTVENHLQRPEIQLARSNGLGVVERYSTTVDRDMLYAAVPATHPRVGYVRVSLPLTAVSAQLRRLALRALVALALAAPFAVLFAWLSSTLLSRRVQAIAAVASRYASGDLTRPAYDYGGDELGTVARVLDASAQELGKRIQELSRDRARTEAILSGMVEGVLVVDRQGRLQLATEVGGTGVFQWDARNDRLEGENPEAYRIFGRNPKLPKLSLEEFVSQVLQTAIAGLRHWPGTP